MRIKKLLIFILFISIVESSFAQLLTDEEKKLYDLVMNYRKSKGLDKIPLSPSLTMVAQLHVKDLMENNPVNDDCNLHSWSFNGEWTGCCYTSDHAQADCMWSKPQELTSYKGSGFEIAHWSSESVNAEGALRGWKSSPGHNAVILNQGVWNTKWNAIGIAILGNYSLIWFGNELDNN